MKAQASVEAIITEMLTAPWLLAVLAALVVVALMVAARGDD
jgi:hypothetical protein